MEGRRPATVQKIQEPVCKIFKNWDAMKNKIIYRMIYAFIPALPVWIILGDFWVGVFVMFLAYVMIHFLQFSFGVQVMAIYDYFSQHFVSAQTGESYNAETLRRIVDSDPVYMEKLKKVIRKYL